MLMSMKHIVQRWLSDRLAMLGVSTSYLDFGWPTLSDGTMFPREWLAFSPDTYLGMYEPRIDPAAEAGVRATSLSHWILLKMLLLLDLIEYIAKKIRAVISFCRLRATKRKLLVMAILMLGFCAWFTFTQRGSVVDAQNEMLEHNKAG
ncbi:hypothetical protein DTO271D3_7935 [Paecilomyces variotii]|nr:hypothetical protein DTO169E5_4976 [Paecilomyces variotii]KAJ9311800.1 hypothetical protein DTO271D3_7935 [Paecilomyces variotii]